MALFEKLLSKSKTKSLFPQQLEVVPDQLNMSELAISVEEVARLIMADKKFTKSICETVTNELLAILHERYDFTPTDKYLEEVSRRKKYIGQLDNYLQERREMNITVENELQLFLQETSLSLTKALDTFTISIQSRIKQAESRHGMDGIKEGLLSMSNNEEFIK